jgi:hypothetical protein
MNQKYATVLDLPVSTLPLTDRSAQYLRDTVQNVETEIDRMVEAEQFYKREAAGCRALRELLTATRDNYARQLAEHSAQALHSQEWPVDPDQDIDLADTCLHCGQPMGWAARYGFVHVVDGRWVAAGEFCVQPAADATTAMPPVEVGGES